jgi:hypothetical protein
LETIKPHQEYIDQLTAGLTADSMSLIDFDRLGQWLGEITLLLSQVESLQSECKTLRQDCIGRISGMMKAVAAVQRSDAGLASIAEVLQNLPSMSASELIRQYHRSSARFRDTFGASFNPIGTSRGGRSQSMDPQLYK